MVSSDATFTTGFESSDQTLGASKLTPAPANKQPRMRVSDDLDPDSSPVLLDSDDGSEAGDIEHPNSPDQGQVLTPELIASINKQVTFYFSDVNLPTDKKFLRQINKDPEGFVPVKLFANFRKIRAITKEVDLIKEALKYNEGIVLNEDGTRARRKLPVLDYDIASIQARTIVVENLPEAPTIESVTDMFSAYGSVKLVRICSRENRGKLPQWLTHSCRNLTQQHAYVEFDSEESAIMATASLHEADEWMDGLKVSRIKPGTGLGPSSSVGANSRRSSVGTWDSGNRSMRTTDVSVPSSRRNTRDQGSQGGRWSLNGGAHSAAELARALGVGGAAGPGASLTGRWSDKTHAGATRNSNQPYPGQTAISNQLQSMYLSGSGQTGSCHGSTPPLANRHTLDTVPTGATYMSSMSAAGGRYLPPAARRFTEDDVLASYRSSSMAGPAHLSRRQTRDLPQRLSHREHHIPESEEGEGESYTQSPYQSVNRAAAAATAALSGSATKASPQAPPNASQDNLFDSPQSVFQYQGQGEDAGVPIAPSSFQQRLSQHAATHGPFVPPMPTLHSRWDRSPSSTIKAASTDTLYQLSPTPNLASKDGGMGSGRRSTLSDACVGCAMVGGVAPRNSSAQAQAAAAAALPSLHQGVTPAPADLATPKSASIATAHLQAAVQEFLDANQPNDEVFKALTSAMTTVAAALAGSPSESAMAEGKAAAGDASNGHAELSVQSVRKPPLPRGTASAQRITWDGTGQLSSDDADTHSGLFGNSMSVVAHSCGGGRRATAADALDLGRGNYDVDGNGELDEGGEHACEEELQRGEGDGSGSRRRRCRRRSRSRRKTHDAVTGGAGGGGASDAATAAAAPPSASAPPAAPPQNTPLHPICAPRFLSGRKDYAAWVAATPEYRSAEFGSGPVNSPMPRRHLDDSASMYSLMMMTPPTRRTTSPAMSVGLGSLAGHRSTPGSHTRHIGTLSLGGGAGLGTPGDHMVVIAKGPDAGAGFAGRGRPLPPPPRQY